MAHSWHAQSELDTLLACWFRWAPRRAPDRLVLHELHTSCKVRISHEFNVPVHSEQILTVTSADFQRNLGLYQDEALKKPVAITKNGRPRTVLISAEEYARLKRRDRRVLEAGEVSERQIAALREAKVPDRFADLDAELKDWKP
jgi:prevent-host-death family protein